MSSVPCLLRAPSLMIFVPAMWMIKLKTNLALMIALISQMLPVRCLMKKIHMYLKAMPASIPYYNQK